MNDILLPYLKNNSGELEACISLIEKNFPHRNIHVLEEFNKLGDYTQTHINQILKLKWAIENLDVTDEFWLWNDDMFLLQPLSDVPYAHKGTIDEHIISRRSKDWYTRSLEETRAILGEGALSYELHIPMRFNKAKLKHLIDELDFTNGNCPLIRSYYGNKYQVGAEYMDDVKNPKYPENMAFISTTESSFRRRYGNFIRSKI